MPVLATIYTDFQGQREKLILLTTKKTSCKVLNLLSLVWLLKQSLRQH